LHYIKALIPILYNIKYLNKIEMIKTYILAALIAGISTQTCTSEYTNLTALEKVKADSALLVI